MPCYHPIPALQYGSEPPQLWPPLGTANLALPCATCVGCRATRATQWAQRCSHEASLWSSNIFVTLTYDDAHLPAGGHLEPDALQRFFKRLRKRRNNPDAPILGDRTNPLRYFACGEYGDRTQRPHYHAILFNCDFRDRLRAGKDLYTSPELGRLWPNGHNTFGDATPAAANYIAQYTLKKQGAGDHDSDGVWRPAPFLRMSLKPAIGTAWLQRYRHDLQHGYLVADGRRAGIPRTYYNKLAQIDPDLAEDINIRKAQHKHRSLTALQQHTIERLAAAETIHKRRKQLTDQRNL